MIKAIKDWLKKDWFGGWGGYNNYLSQLWSVGDPVYSQVRYEILSAIGYMNNPIVYRCINMIATNVSSVPFKLYRKMEDNRDVEIEQSPILDLLQKPNPFISRNDFFSYLVAYLQISGNAYVKRAGPSNGPPRELYNLRPDFIEIIDDCDQFCYDDYMGRVYEYTCGKSKERINPRDLCHIKNFNPLCELYGLSPLSPCLRSIEQLNASFDWNVSLLQNAATPSGILSTEQNLSDEQVTRLREQLSQKQQGTMNARRPILAEGGLKWNTMSMTPLDMDFVKMQENTIKQICVCLGVDVVLLGDSEARNYATYENALQSYYTETILPLCDKITSEFLNGWLLPQFPNTSNMYFTYSIEDIESLNENHNLVYERIIKAFDAGVITVNEAREALGYSELMDDEELESEEPQNEEDDDEQMEEEDS